MKIEIGESLIYSFLRHEKNCLITQTNWKASGAWPKESQIEEEVHDLFLRIGRHPTFSDLFKRDFSQTIKQGEIDVLGIDKSGHVYAYDVAFHENGLQYGDKIETRNRIIKKLLRGYLTLQLYFPEHFYSIAFCSPKVGPSTELHIQEYFDILNKDFHDPSVTFEYFSNQRFTNEILEHTLLKSEKEADSSELFSRSIKLFNLLSRAKTVNLSPVEVEPTQAVMQQDDAETLPTVVISGVEIPTSKDSRETMQDFVKRIMHLLLDKHLLSAKQLQELQDKQYCKDHFYLQFPLIRHRSQDYRDGRGRSRYWTKELFGGEYYVCSQWWKEHDGTYMKNIYHWLVSLSNAQ